MVAYTRYSYPFSFWHFADSRILLGFGSLYLFLILNDENFKRTTVSHRHRFWAYNAFLVESQLLYFISRGNRFVESFLTYAGKGGSCILVKRIKNSRVDQ